MHIRSLVFLFVVFWASTPFWANAATYSYYFSNNAAGNPVGSDTTGNGSQSAPWKTLAKAKSAIDARSSSDTVYLFFDSGDIWTWNSSAVPGEINGFVVDSTNPVVHIDAYGSGNKPVFDGQVTSFDTAAAPNATTGPLEWSRFFEIKRDGCSISNVEITQCYGFGVYLNDADNFTLSYSDVNKIGKGAINFNGTYGLTGSTVKYCVMHTQQELERAGLTSGKWGSAIQFGNNGASARVYNNHIHHNILYNIYGEGMHVAGSTVEYNLIGDTGSVGIDAAAFRYNFENTVIRYNHLVFSSYGTSIYDSLTNGERSGIRVFDEYIGGTNSGATVEIYGNTVINRAYGISLKCTTGPSDECGNPVGNLLVYNNTFIDNAERNIRVVHPADVAINAYIFNNASILYDRTTGTHVSDNDELPAAGWNISNNAFWTNGTSPVVDADWRAKYVVANPMLSGEPTVDWDGLTGATYFLNIDPTAHLYPVSGSPLLVNGLRLGSSYNNKLLTVGTKLNSSPEKSVFVTTAIGPDASWPIGAYAAPAQETSTTIQIPPPSGVTVDVK
jgi:hypothetical protein